MRYIDSPLQKRSKHQAELAMVFSSLPPYHLDSSNWHHQHIIGSSNSPQAPVPPPPQQPHGGSNNIRAGSMSERARQANIPMPEPAQRCPRCDSTNTKFCYFNNYSLTQPRHFCKTCRRYWTRGGALRTVPVGGGCRRNKRTSSSSSSSKATSSSSSGSKSSPAPQSTTNNNNNNIINNNLPYGLSSLGPHFQPMLMSQLSEGFTGEMMMNLNTYNNNNNINNINNNNIPSSSDYHASSNSFLGFEQWKMQQFPFLGGLDLSLPGVYNEFQGDGQKMTSSLGQMGSTVKMEESKNPAGQLSLMSRDQWSRDINMNGNGGGSASAAANNWTHQLSSFASPSTSNHLQ